MNPKKWALQMATAVSLVASFISLGGTVLFDQLGIVSDLRNSLMLSLIQAPTIAFLLGYIVCWVNANHVFELVTSHERFAQLSNTDALTGLYNRLGLYTHCVGIESPYCVAFFDIDHFKLVNDKFGHLAGDTVISSVASVLREQFSDGAKLSRLGGEEFVVVQALSFPDFLRVCETVRSTIQKMTIDFEGHAINVTISIGIAYRNPREMFEKALQKADLALYEAKNSGRNRIYADFGSSQKAVA